MNVLPSQTKDDRRAKRRSSAWLGILVLGAMLGGMICFGPWKSRPGDSQTESNPQRADESAPTAVTRAANPVTVSLPELLANLERESDPGAQEEFLTDLVSSRSLAEIPAALQQLADCTNRMALDLASRWMRRWAESDPQAATALAVALPEGVFRSTLLEQAALAWTELNWSEAGDWARQLTGESDRDRMIRVVAEETIRLEPLGALRLATELTPSRERDELIHHATMEWAGQDAPAAEQWARQIDDPVLRHQLLAAIAIAWADQDAPAAATFAVRDLPPGRTQDDAVVSILNRWIQTDAEAAAAWVSQFPAGPLKQAALDGVLAIWSVNDPARAREWLAQATAGNQF